MLHWFAEKEEKQGILEYASANVMQVFGYHKRQLVGQNVSMLCAEPHRSLHDSYLAAHAAGGPCRVLNMARNVSALHASGSEFPISLQVSKYRGGFKAKVFPLEDVDVMVMVDEKNVVVSATNKCRILFGRVEKEMVDLDFDSFFRKNKPSTMADDGMQEAELIAMDGSPVKVGAVAASFESFSVFFSGLCDEELDEGIELSVLSCCLCECGVA